MFSEPKRTGDNITVTFYSVCGAGGTITIIFIAFAELRRAGDKITVTFIKVSAPGTTQPLFL